MRVCGTHPTGYLPPVVPDSVAPLIVRARLTCALAAVTTLLCAGLMTAAVLVPAPLAALPLLVPVCLGLPVVAALEVPDAVFLLLAVRRAGLSRRHLARLRRELEQLPETSHPLGL